MLALLTLPHLFHNHAETIPAERHVLRLANSVCQLGHAHAHVTLTKNIVLHKPNKQQMKPHQEDTQNVLPMLSLPPIDTACCCVGLALVQAKEVCVSLQ